MSNATAVAVREFVDPNTGVVSTVGTFDLGAFLRDIDNPTAIAQQKALAAAYDKACLALIGDNDVQKEGSRSFKKKSAWRKLARYFHISTSVVRVEKEVLADGNFLATITVRATAPWGQYAEAIGACCTDEATGRRVISTADAIATAETRATNRSTSNLIAMGEVSAEEIGSDRQSQGGSRSAPKSAAKKVMPFGQSKGMELGEIESDDLRSTVKWCREKDAKKFAELIAACEEVLRVRDDDGSASLALGGDDENLIPF